MKRIIDIINKVRPDLPVDSNGFISNGILDSIDIVFIINDISKNFNIDIPTKDVNAFNFDSAEHIYKYLNNRI